MQARPIGTTSTVLDHGDRSAAGRPETGDSLRQNALGRGFMAFQYRGCGRSPFPRPAPQCYSRV